MRNILVAVIGVLTMTLFVGSSFATAPVASDIPDIRLLTGSGTVEDFDLNDYVTDYDDDPATLNWTIQSQVGFDVVTDPASVASGLVDIGGSAAADQGVITYRVADASEYAEDTQVVKYSSFWLVGPSLTQDNNLVPEDAFPRTWILEADTVLTTPVLADLLVGITPPVDNMYVCIADLAGDWQAGDNATSASFGDLDAAISGDGKLVLQTPSLPAVGNLTGAYRVGVKAKNATGGLAGVEDNWDGMELLVASTRIPLDQRNSSNTLSQAAVDKFNGFETSLGAMVTVIADMRTAGDKWYKLTGTGAAAIVNTQPASAWATSGNALEVTVAPGESVFILSDFFTDIQAGETLTFEANVTTDVALGAQSCDVMLFMGNFRMPGNYQGVSLQCPTALQVQVPTGGSDGWRTIKATFKADTIGADIGGYNFYSNYQCAINVKNGWCPSTVKVYVDDVNVYKCVDPIEAALGATELDVTVGTGTNPFDGTIETATVLGDLDLVVDIAQGTAAINTVAANNMFTHDGSKSLEVYVPAGTTSQTEFMHGRVGIAAADQGAGIFGASVWIKTNSPDVQSNPDIMLLLADVNYRNVPFVFSGLVSAPLDGAGWKKLSVDTAMVSSFARLLYAISVKQAGAITALPGWPDDMNDTGVNTPGIQSDGHVFFDDFKFHKYQDDVMYFDRSVFPATD